MFADWVEGEATPEWKRAAILALQGKRLACWCKSGAPCHADFLLREALHRQLRERKMK
jgi:Domain of unknown function (DUF4326)